MKSIIFWDMTQCSPLSFAQHFGGIIVSIFRFEEIGSANQRLSRKVKRPDEMGIPKQPLDNTGCRHRTTTALASNAKKQLNRQDGPTHDRESTRQLNSWIGSLQGGRRRSRPESQDGRSHYERRTLESSYERNHHTSSSCTDK
jgi:hypothetical protein